jgi:hypothetical protein
MTRDPEALVDGHELDAQVMEFSDARREVEDRPGPAVDLADRYHVDVVPAGLGHDLRETRALDVPARRDIDALDRDLVALTGGPLTESRELRSAALVAGADPRVQRRAHHGRNSSR